ncbi:MAG: 3-hydroxyanthranilate 3,4-dioxygenase [Ignavibacteria bacterium]|jgi:3-hydroxyanthranilate 3,4-dioxygenase|nr:3-hydroxyanthranilate 3,4-dioxygenase [Ignavibacteria bacterium]
MLQSFNFKEWIEENRHLLKPPVGNKCIVNDDLIIMVVGGPNTRKDYHYEDGAEFFYQVEGDITVRVIEDGKPRDIVIKEGEIFYLPPNIPHSPQRPADTVGLVIERKREPKEYDSFQWYCENCGEKLHEETIKLTDIGSQLPPIFEKYWGDESKRTCKNCGTVMQPPAK